MIPGKGMWPEGGRVKSYDELFLTCRLCRLLSAAFVPRKDKREAQLAALAALKKARRDVCKGAGPASGAAVAIDENVPPATAQGGSFILAVPALRANCLARGVRRSVTALHGSDRGLVPDCLDTSELY